MRYLYYGLTIVLLFSTPAFAEKFSIYIAKKDDPFCGTLGHTCEGDVVGITPYKDGVMPTKGEDSNYWVIVVDMTKEEADLLLEEDLDGEKKKTKDRKRKIKVKNLNLNSQMKVITKNELDQNITIKP